MSIDKLLVAILGAIGIVFTYWFFLRRIDEIMKVNNSVDIIVEGGYSPEVIAISKGKTTKINFIRKDPNSCLEEVVLSDFKIKKFLPLNKKVVIELTPQKIGEHPFSCGMNMYHGKILVK